MNVRDRLYKHWISRCVLFLLTLCSIVSCGWTDALRIDRSAAQPISLAKTVTKPQPQDWQVKGIMSALSDPDPGVRFIAFGELDKYDLTGIPQQPAIAKQALTRLRNPSTSEDERWGAAIALGNSGNAARAYIKDLGQILRDDRTAMGIRGDVAYVMGQLGTAAAPYIPDLVRLAKLRGGGDPPRYNAVTALAKLDTPTTRSAKELLDIARDRDLDASFRNKALEELGKAQTAAEYAGDLSELLKDPRNYPFPACGAAESLGRMDNAVTPYVLQMWNFFTDRRLDTSTRNCAATALANLDSAATVPHAAYFLNVLKNTSSPTDERQQAAKILGNIYSLSTATRRDLVALLKHPQTETVVKIELATTLGNSGDVMQPNFTDFRALVISPTTDRDLRSAAAVAFGTSERAVTALMSILKEPNLDRIGREVVASRLDDLDPAVIRPHARALITLATKLGKISAVQTPADARRAGGYELKQLGTAAQPYLSELTIAIVTDKRYEFSVRSGAATAIVNSDKSLKSYTKDLIAFAAETIARSPGDMSPLYAIEHLKLSQLAPLSATDLRPIVKILDSDNRELGRQYGRFMVYLYNGGKSRMS
jgi:hypothetical protein